MEDDRHEDDGQQMRHFGVERRVDRRTLFENLMESEEYDPRVNADDERGDQQLEEEVNADEHESGANRENDGLRDRPAVHARMIPQDGRRSVDLLSDRAVGAALGHVNDRARAQQHDRNDVNEEASHRRSHYFVGQLVEAARDPRLRHFDLAGELIVGPAEDDPHLLEPNHQQEARECQQRYRIYYPVDQTDSANRKSTLFSVLEG